MQGSTKGRCNESRNGYMKVSSDMKRVLLGVLLILALGVYYYQYRAEERTSCLLLMSGPYRISPKEAREVIGLFVDKYPACTRYAAAAYSRMIQQR